MTAPRAARQATGVVRSSGAALATPLDAFSRRSWRWSLPLPRFRSLVGRCRRRLDWHRPTIAERQAEPAGRSSATSSAFVLFGLYPPAERWRAAVALRVLVALIVVTGDAARVGDVGSSSRGPSA